MRRGVRLKFVKVITKPSGLRFVYYRKPGCKRAKLPDLPENDPVFLAAYAEAAKSVERAPSRREPGEGSIAALCTSYRRSPTFQGLRTSTRQMRARIIDKIAVKAGTALVADLIPKHIRKDIGDLTPHAANNRLKIWRALMKHAVGLALIEINPARDVETQKTKGGGFHCWTDEEITQYRAHHPSGTKARLAFELLLWTGARRGDLVRLGHQNVSGGSLTYISEKTEIKVCIPVLAEAQVELDRMPKNQRLFLPTPRGDQYCANGLGKWFVRRCREAALPKRCSLHGLRKARARRMAEAGATTHTIAAWGGWKTLSEVAHYTEAVDRRKLTHAGIEQERNFANPTDQVGENREKPNEINGGN